MTNSGDSPRSRTVLSHLPGWTAPALVALALAAVIALSVWFCCANRYILYYGDAQAHLDISRSLIDSRNPGYDQLGTVWLPLLHVICLPLVGNMNLWSNGLAGAIPVAMCFVLAGLCCFLVARDVFDNTLAATIAVACLALNPNVLYLGSIPMTEVVFLAGLFVFLLSVTRGWFVVAVLASWAMSLTRYDGWFLIPFEGLWFVLIRPRQRRVQTLILFGVLAGLVPLYWAGHCWWETGNALDFINGPYSAKAIQGGKPYPGWQDWAAALTYYARAGRDCAGWPLLVLGILGSACAIARGKARILFFLVLTPAFYVWSLHSSGTPIHVPELWPFSYYNTRYGIAVVALAAFAAGAIVLVLPERHRLWAVLIPVLALAPWLVHPAVQNVICWRESDVNSIARRQWTREAAQFLDRNYQPDQQVLASFGDLTGIFCKAKLPLREVLHEGSGPYWDAAMARPDLLHPAAWGIAQRGTKSDTVMRKAAAYTLYEPIATEGAPVLDIFQRTYAENPVH